MAYVLKGLVASPPVVAEVLGRFQTARPTILDEGLQLIVLTDALVEEMSKPSARVPSDPFWMSLPGLEPLLREVSQVGSIAYIEAEYVGRLYRIAG